MIILLSLILVLNASPKPSQSWLATPSYFTTEAEPSLSSEEVRSFINLFDKPLTPVKQIVQEMNMKQENIEKLRHQDSYAIMYKNSICYFVKKSKIKNKLGHLIQLSPYASHIMFEMDYDKAVEEKAITVRGQSEILEARINYDVLFERLKYNRKFQRATTIKMINLDNYQASRTQIGTLKVESEVKFPERSAGRGKPGQTQRKTEVKKAEKFSELPEDDRSKSSKSSERVLNLCDMPLTPVEQIYKNVGFVDNDINKRVILSKNTQATRYKNDDDVFFILDREAIKDRIVLPSEASHIVFKMNYFDAMQAEMITVLDTDKNDKYKFYLESFLKLYDENPEFKDSIIRSIKIMDLVNHQPAQIERKTKKVESEAKFSELPKADRSKSFKSSECPLNLFDMPLTPVEQICKEMNIQDTTINKNKMLNKDILVKRYFNHDEAWCIVNRKAIKDRIVLPPEASHIVFKMNYFDAVQAEVIKILATDKKYKYEFCLENFLKLYDENREFKDSIIRSIKIMDLVNHQPSQIERKTKKVESEAKLPESSADKDKIIDLSYMPVQPSQNMMKIYKMAKPACIREQEGENINHIKGISATRKGNSIYFFVSQDKIGNLMKIPAGTTHLVLKIKYNLASDLGIAEICGPSVHTINLKRFLQLYSNDYKYYSKPRDEILSIQMMKLDDTEISQFEDSATKVEEKFPKLGLVDIPSSEDIDLNSLD